MRLSKIHYFSILFILSLFSISTYAQYDNVNPVELNVDFDAKLGELKPIWAFWGHDEPNYTYMKDGKKLLTEISELSKVPVFLRVHSLLVTGDGEAALKWGSTNAYTEDEQGNPIYDWTIIDKIFDTYIDLGIKPLAQIGFMPEALSSKPKPYRHYWKPGAKYEEIFTGWAYPPKDYEKWAELVYQWVTHAVDRYGKEEVESWYWELWNEPNIGYWRGTIEEYIKLYDYTADAVKRALPEAKMGGPETTGPGWDKAEEFLRTFLDHIVSGKNYVTGETGAPLDFITYHAKGSPKLVDGQVHMNMGAQLNDLAKGFEIVASYPTLKHLPIIIGESDPEGCAACSEEDYPENAYRNGTMYSSYTAASFARKYAMAAAYDVNLVGAVTWGFEFEDQAWYAGFRDMATNGVDKPVLNVFRMFGMMHNTQVAVTGDLDYDYKKIRKESVRGNPDVNALASVGTDGASIMVFNYHDRNDLEVLASPVTINLKHVPATKVLVNQYRVDQEFSNSYTLYKEMGSPENPTQKQIDQLEQAGHLQLATSPKWVTVTNGELVLTLDLPRQGVALFQLEFEK
ncbi:GH39 family glycosyl hydrolase [Leeuwenhoekiella sp. MAR_2009_132]|uniref:GH39 family glycosyl hydrolase n=1 Tax=Leeuwenhoekiella sp. MAR_2009_132 TaxID=1392489 RepID=UPI0004917449|nr:beta-xylosidase [Leeuwenhoekiella sp. MAR_2009_132]